MKVHRDVQSSTTTTLKYAQISGDWNPAHTDEQYAKRDGTLPEDTSIVHGTHIMGWFSSLLNQIGAETDSEVILVDMFTEFHNPLPIEREARVVAEIDDDDLPSDDEPQVVSEVGLRAIDPQSEMEYTTGSATIMLDATVDRVER